MKRMWIVTIGVGAALLISALAWAGSRPDDPDDDDNGGSVWMSQRQPSGMMGRRGFAGTRGGLLARRQELLEDLDLSRDQAKEIAEIRDEQRRRAIDRRAEIQVAALDLRKLMRANRPDRGAIRASDRRSSRTLQSRAAQVAGRRPARHARGAHARAAREAQGTLAGHRLGLIRRITRGRRRAGPGAVRVVVPGSCRSLRNPTRTLPRSSPRSAPAAWARSIAPRFAARPRRRDQGDARSTCPRTPTSERASSARRARSRALNHPHICTLHDVGREGDTDFLVMELVEGESLADRIARGRCRPTRCCGSASRSPTRSTRRIAPASSIAISSPATSCSPSPAPSSWTSAWRARPVVAATTGSRSQSPTMTRPLTVEGSIVGTFQYMAPEQLEGAEADARTRHLGARRRAPRDGRPGRSAFGGQSQASLIASILKAEPPPVSQAQPLSAAGARSPDPRLPRQGPRSSVSRPRTTSSSSSSGSPRAARRPACRRRSPHGAAGASRRHGRSPAWRRSRRWRSARCSGCAVKSRHA